MSRRTNQSLLDHTEEAGGCAPPNPCGPKRKSATEAGTMTPTAFRITIAAACMAFAVCIVVGLYLIGEFV